MREILFRGKRKDNCKWVEGYLHKRDGLGTGYTEFAIQVQESSASRPWSCTVIPETVSEYTGLKDKNSKRIFEGDIIETHSGTKGVVAFGNHQDDEDAGYSCGWYFKEIDENDISYTLSLHDEWSHHQVIGNVHDHPELIAEVEGCE